MTTKKLLENSILYTISGVLTKCVSFFMLPLYTAALSTTDYGIYSLINSFVSVALYFVSMGLESAIMRFYVDYKDDHEKLKGLISTCVCVVFATDGIFMALCFILRGFLYAQVLEGVAFYPYVLLGLIELSCLSVNTMYRTLLRASGSGRKLTVTGLITFGITTFTTVLLVLGLRRGAAGMLAAAALSRLCFLVYALFDMKKQNLISARVDFSMLKKSLKYSLPIIPHSMSSTIASFVSKLFLSSSSSLSTLGVYTVSFQFANVIDTFQDSVGHAFRPWINEKLTVGAQGIRDEIKRVSETLLSLYTVVFLGISFFSYEVIALLINPRYFEAWKAVPILSVAYSLKAIYYFYIFLCFYYTNLSNKIFIISVASNLLNIVISYVLTPLYGMYGTAIALMIADLGRTVGSIILAGTRGKEYYSLGRLSLIVVICWGVIAIGVIPAYLINPVGFHWQLFVYKFTVFILFSVVLIAIKRKSITAILHTYRKSKEKHKEQK